MAGLRSAQAAIDGARAAIERLDDGRRSEDNAADLIEAWEGAQSAIRALSGSSLTGHALIREARQRNLLSLDQAHSVVEFNAAADRARDPSYQPNASDLAAARAGFHLLAAALSQALAEKPRPATPPAPSPPPPSKPSEDAFSPVPAPRTTSGSLLARGIVAVALLAIIGASVFYVVQYRGRVGHLRRGTTAYAAGDRITAKREFAAAAENDARAAVPHIYLGRIARDEGDPVTAARELTVAVNLEPNNSLALREMAAHLLALGNLDLARRFYVRALTADPNDRTAQGYLACTLARLGRFEEAQRFALRAGPGEWSNCLAAAIGAPPATAAPPRR